MEWRKDNYVRLLFDDGGLETLVGYVAGELVCAIEVPLHKASASQGMLGNLNGVWLDDGRRELRREERNDARDSGGERRDGHRRGTVHRLRHHEHGRPVRRRQIAHAPTHANSLLEMSGTGYMLHLDNSYVAFDPLDTTDHLAEFTLSFWVNCRHRLRHRPATTVS